MKTKKIIFSVAVFCATLPLGFSSCSGNHSQGHEEQAPVAADLVPLDSIILSDPAILAEPITPPNYGHGMIFKDFQGRDILSAHSHSEVNGRYVRRPNFWEVDLSGDELRIVKKMDLQTAE